MRPSRIRCESAACAVVADAWSPRERRCAVVGSSAELLRHAHGGNIDAHAAVYRVNKAPVKGFEAQVGTRTTMRMWMDRVQPDQSDAWMHANETIVVKVRRPRPPNTPRGGI